MVFSKADKNADDIDNTEQIRIICVHLRDTPGMENNLFTDYDFVSVNRFIIV